MIESDVRTIEYQNGEFQRVQLVRFDSWESLDFLFPDYSPDAFSKVVSLYSDFIVPSKPSVFGQLVLFALPDGSSADFSHLSIKYGSLFSDLTAAAVAMRNGVKIIGGKPVFLNGKIRSFYRELEEKGCVRIVRGSLPMTTILPVGKRFGFLSESEKDAKLKVNSSFFIMDRFDCSTAYDSIGTPVGLMVKNGDILNPPLYRREALMVKKDGSVSIGTPVLENLSVEISGKAFTPGDNALVYTRPETRKTPSGKRADIVIIGRKVAAVKWGGQTMVPSSGFVLGVKDGSAIKPGDDVVFHGMEDVLFSIQVGNSIVVNGEKTEYFKSPFYNIYKLWSISFPPSLYPLDFEKARAPRIALGADKDNHPMLAWIEGPGKFTHEKGVESCGASLSELADIIENLGMYNAVNLDGGGSAQILINGKRSLLISDRVKEDNSEAERAVPAGLIIR